MTKTKMNNNLIETATDGDRAAIHTCSAARRLSLRAAAALLLTAVAALAACQPNASIMNSKPQNAAADTAGAQKSAFERDLDSMKTANFDFIYVMRRKDGAKFSGDDGAFIKLNSPPETNRFIKTDEEKAVIAGSKYKFADVNLKALRERFDVQDLSVPNAANANSNAGTAANK